MEWGKAPAWTPANCVLAGRCCRLPARLSRRTRSLSSSQWSPGSDRYRCTASTGRATALARGDPHLWSAVLRCFARALKGCFKNPLALGATGSVPARALFLKQPLNVGLPKDPDSGDRGMSLLRRYSWLRTASNSYDTVTPTRTTAATTTRASSPNSGTILPQQGGVVFHRTCLPDTKGFLTLQPDPSRLGMGAIREMSCMPLGMTHSTAIPSTCGARSGLVTNGHGNNNTWLASASGRTEHPWRRDVMEAEPDVPVALRVQPRENRCRPLRSRGQSRSDTKVIQPAGNTPVKR